MSEKINRYDLSYEARESLHFLGDLKHIVSDLENMFPGQRCIVCSSYIDADYDKKEIVELGKRLKRELGGAEGNYKLRISRHKDKGEVFDLD